MTQNSRDLILMVGESSVSPDLFASYNTQNFILNGYKIEVNVIGESHLIVCETGEKKSFTEVLACVSPDKVKSNLIKKFPLSGYNRLSMWDLVFFEHLKYSFWMDKIDFDDQNYKPALLNFLLIPSAGNETVKRIYYNFSTKSAEFKSGEIYDPITLISAGTFSVGLFWNSIHVYPEEKLGVFSQSILGPRR